MDLSQGLEQLNAIAESIFTGGSRYQNEKIATIVVYAVVVAATLVWVFSGGEADSDLGADVTTQRLEIVDDQNIFIKNDSDDDWTQVRVVLNGKYLHKLDRVPADTQETLRPRDFSYYFYIPRPWDQEGWQSLGGSDQPDASAPSQLDIELVQIRAKEGREDISFADGTQVKRVTGDDVSEVR